ncbi:MAG: sulfite exporter TauE/SafE family protein [Planctomycetes bacterium]|nr:sulfite exporter TauE/SafE family protein [Planctomycetota bacterium]
MFFPTAGIEVALWIPPLVALAISFFTSMGGVSGAFLLLPFQMSFLGYTNPSVSATNQLFNVVAIPSGVYRYWKEGRMVWPLTWVVIAGTLPGVFAGAYVRITYLPDPRRFKLFAAAVLLYIGARLIRDLLKRKPAGGAGCPPDQDLRRRSGTAAAAVRAARLDARRLSYTFQGQTFAVSIWGVFVLSLLVGIVGGIYGIGGGAIIAPFLVAFFALPVPTVAGAALMGTFVTSIAGVAFYQAMAPFHPGMSVAPDWLLGSLFGLGGAAGMYLGARCQKFVPARTIKWMLAGVIVFTAAKYVADFLRS